MKLGLAILFAGCAVQAQTAPRGTATDIPSAEIQAAAKKTASSAVSDQQLRVVSINGEYNVAIGVLHRNRASAQNPAGALEHSEVTEIYQIVSGTGTFVTGGTMDNPKASAPDSQIVKVLDGPSTSGGPIRNGVSRKVGPGDMIVIPPNTPHGFTEIDDQVVYTVVRVDPHKILPAGYAAK
jgi:mannose-6-phosphate isomerase-like protein (cupin superfamily)